MRIPRLAGTVEFEIHWKTYQEGSLVGEGSTDPMAVVSFGFECAPQCAQEDVIEVWVEAWGERYAGPFLEDLRNCIVHNCPQIEVRIIYYDGVIHRYITSLLAGDEKPTILLAPVLFYPRSPSFSEDCFLSLAETGSVEPLDELGGEVIDKFPSMADFMYRGHICGVPFEIVDWSWAFMVNPYARKDSALAFLRSFIHSLIRPFEVE